MKRTIVRRQDAYDENPSERRCDIRKNTYKKCHTLEKSGSLTDLGLWVISRKSLEVVRKKRVLHAPKYLKQAQEVGLFKGVEQNPLGLRTGVPEGVEYQKRGWYLGFIPIRNEEGGWLHSPHLKRGRRGRSDLSNGLLEKRDKQTCVFRLILKKCFHFRVKHPGSRTSDGGTDSSTAPLEENSDADELLGRCARAVRPAASLSGEPKRRSIGVCLSPKDFSKRSALSSL